MRTTCFTLLKFIALIFGMFLFIGLCSDKILDLCDEEVRDSARISVGAFLVVCLCPRRVLGYYLQLDHDHILQIITLDAV
jgi:hypothetical protein